MKKREPRTEGTADRASAAWVIASLMITLVLASCSGTKLPRRNDTRLLNSTNFKTLDGVYANAPEGGSYNSECLWCYLLFPKSHALTQWASHRVKLQMVNRKTLRAQLLTADGLRAERTIKGKIKNGAFRVKQSRVRGVPFIFFTSEEIAFQLAPGTDSTLKLDAEISSYGNIFILSAGATKYEAAAYKKLFDR